MSEDEGSNDYNYTAIKSRRFLNNKRIFINLSIHVLNSKYFVIHRRRRGVNVISTEILLRS